MTQPPGHGPAPGDGPPPGYYGAAPGYGPPPGYYGATYGPPPGYYGPPPGYYGPPPGYYGPPGGYYGYGPSPGYYRPGYGPPRPGCVPLRPLGVGDILDGAFSTVRRNPRVMLGLSACFAFVRVTLTTVASLVVFANLPDSNTSDTNVDLGPVLGSEALQLVTLFVTVLVNAVLTGMLTTAVTQDVLGHRLSISDVWSRVRPRIGTVLGLAAVTTIVQFLGVLLCIAPGVWLWGIWAVAMPACMVENLGVGASLRRSHDLVRGTFWRVWGIRALGYLVVSIVGNLMVLPFVLIAAAAGAGGLSNFLQPSGVPVLFLLITAVGSLISATVTAPITAAIDALLYVDLRMRKEGLDIALQQATAPSAAAPPMTAG